MKKTIFLFFALIGLINSCGKNQGETTIHEDKAHADGVEILYFHGDMRCKNCVAMEKGITQLLENELSEQVKDGKVSFKIIDITTPEGEEIADNYGVTWSSLFVNNWIDGEEERKDMTRFGMQNAAKNPDEFKQEIKALIEEYLSN